MRPLHLPCHHLTPPDTVEETITIGSVKVQATAGVTNSCWYTRSYEWEQDGLYLTVFSTFAGDVTDKLLLELVATTMGLDPATIDGSAFTLPNAREAELGQPTATGLYCGLTLEEAQELVEFEIVKPDNVPPAFEFTKLYLKTPVIDPSAPPNTATMLYRLVDAEKHWEFVTLSQGHSGMISTPRQAPSDLSELETITIAGTEVTKVVTAFTPDPSSALPTPAAEEANPVPMRQVAYHWQMDGVDFKLDSGIRPASQQVSDEALEQLVAAVLEAGSG